MWMFVLATAAAQGTEEVEVDFLCNDDERTFGVAPYEVTCTAVLEESADHVEWLNGLGDVIVGETFTSEYAEPGQYSVSMYVDGYGDKQKSLSLRRDGMVVVCGEPEPDFELIDKGGRDYQVVNQTGANPLCITSMEWEIRAGDQPDGRLLQRYVSWEPRFQLEENGLYTIALTAMGRGGVATTTKVLDAQFGLTEEYSKHYATACTTAGSQGAWWLLVPLLAVARRRRT